jgi:GntR family transcriptional regulator
MDTASLIAQVEFEIRRLEIRPGERLGSERELAERFGVPRSALRSALESLESRQMIRRSMGSSGGVFVSDGKLERQLNTIQGVPAMLRQQGVSMSTEVLRVDVSIAGPAETRALFLEPGENVFRVTRRRDANGIPWSLDTSVLPARLFPGLTQLDLSGSLYGLLAEKYGIEPAEADETIDTVEADPAHAKILSTTEGASLIEIWRTTRTSERLPIEFAHDFFRADRTRIHLRRYGASWKRA